MSVAARLISGTAASWAQIGITLVTQIALVPLYLSYWDVKTYGLWLAILSLSGLLSALDLGFQEYIGYEFLRTGKHQRRVLSEYLCSGMFIGFLLGLLQLLVITGLLLFGLLHRFVDGRAGAGQQSLLSDAGLILLMQGLSWLICGSIGGILTRSLSTFGYYPRMAWWGVFSAFFLNFSPAVMVVSGGGLLKTGIVMAVARVLADIPIYIDMLRLLKREKISFVRPSFTLGWHIFIQSVGLSVSNLMENMRQQGARLLLTPFTGTAGLAAFSTMRTGANVAMQGLHTVTNPLMPELMRFLHNRDQARSEMAFGTVWIVAIAILAPAVVYLQSFIQPLYAVWTRGQIPFQPWLFATLSLSVLVYATAQPAIAVVRGNNLLRPQVIISTLSATIALSGIGLLVPHIGIPGAGISLLAAEITSSIAYRHTAKKWLHQHGLSWPEKAFTIASSSVWIGAIAMGGMVLFPYCKWLILLASFIAFYWNTRRYLRTLPLLTNRKAIEKISKMPLIRFFFPR
ncbi:lipopolysaccharide biosynthesis protein [Pedobacter sp. AW31-3R]|uniref:lipopolysaccharide biosynthesis protein n=1 Tax=Pedobacter sp. AW31-3R TaxID=3445781 RepID=UPI003FA0FE4D